jgi:predicted RNA-binding Zn ribbon-like protein
MTEMATPAVRGPGNAAAFPRLLGERLCLDFANSVESPLTEPEEFLTDVVALARWGQHVGLLDEPQVAIVQQAVAADHGYAERLYEDAMALRAGIQATFQSIAEEREIVQDGLAVIERAYVRGLQSCRLAPQAGQAHWTWNWPDERNLSAAEFVLWQVAQSAVEVLTDGDVSRVKRCECGWLFYDTSRNGSRRWCSMEGCGTQAKMRRFTAKRRATRGSRGEQTVADG